MILAVDVGNTNIVLGWIEDGNILKTYRIHTSKAETSAEYAIKLKQMFDFSGIDEHRLDGVIICSVVPAVTEALKTAMIELTGKMPMVVGPGVKTGLNIRIDDPGTLAGDLLVGAVAAMAYYPVPSIVIDMGTATTICVVDKDKAFRGGAIIPGVNLSYNALASGTSLLPSISITGVVKAVGTNTVDCMRSGAVFGTASMLDGMIDRMEEEIGEKCFIVATGGLAPGIIPFCRHDITCDDDLLLKGLWVLFKKNS